MRKCSGCDIEKDPSEFFRNSVKKDGLDSKCKICRKSARDAWMDANRDSYVIAKKDWYKENRADILEKKRNYNRLFSKEISERNRVRRQANPRKHSARIRAWRESNREAVLEKSREYRQSIQDALFELLGNECALCGEKEREFLTVDHLSVDGREHRKMGSIGWKRAILTGRFSPSDFRILCHSCNNSSYRKNPIHHVVAKPAMGTSIRCIRCNSSKDVSLFCSQRSHSARLCLECKKEEKEGIVRRCHGLLGAKCRCCGQSDSSKLTIDHLNGDGGVRRRLGERAGVDLCRKIVGGKIPLSDFQLLCWNCNYSKNLGGICLHARNLGPRSRSPESTSGKSCDVLDFDFLKVSVSRIPGSDTDSVSKLLEESHYGGFGRPAKALYGAFLDGTLTAVVKLATPVRQGIAPSVGMLEGEVLELDRMCIHPEYQKKNMASFLLSKVVRLVKIDFPEVFVLVSFADPRFGHSGVVYKAANWEYVGNTSSSYVYLKQDGSEVNKKSVYNWARKHGLKEREAADELKLRKSPTPPKSKFIYKLREKTVNPGHQ